MYTQCPHCQTCFRIAEAHLKAAKGKVRCGSCQEVFDATGHLYTKLPAIPENMIPPAEDISITPKDLERLDHEHIDLFATPVKGTTPIPTEQPDQSAFMESTIGENTRYNNLDKMGSVSIPGEIEFGDSFIKFGETPEAEQADEPAGSSNPYEDVESKEATASSREVEEIQDLYTTADELMRNDDDGEALDKHIDELLAFTNRLDEKKDLSKPAASTINDDFDDLDDLDDLISIDPEPAAPSTEHKTNDRNEKEDGSKQRNRSIQFDAMDLAIEPLTGEQASFTDSVLGIKDPNPHLAFNNEPITNPYDKQDKKQSNFENELDDIDLDDEVDALDQQPESLFEDHSDELDDDVDVLPSQDRDIPLALRRSLEKADVPERPLLQTVGLGFLIVILVAGMLTQLILFRSVDLARMSQGLAPILTSLCQTLPCRYTGPLDVSKISLTNRDVRSHPTQKNALLISAAFVNQASFDQPYPDIMVTLSDLSGNIVANRRFRPQEYLDNMYNRFLLMESGTPVHITLPVLDPGSDAINFEFTFL